MAVTEARLQREAIVAFTAARRRCTEGSDQNSEEIESDSVNVSTPSLAVVILSRMGEGTY